MDFQVSKTKRRSPIADGNRGVPDNPEYFKSEIIIQKLFRVLD